MANTYIPTNLRVLSTAGNKVTVAWDFPAPGLAPLYTYNVYTSLSPTNPIVASATLSGVPRQQASVINPSPPANFYVAVSSVDINTTNESTQSSSILVSTNSSATTSGAAIAKSESGIPKFLKTNEDGNLVVAERNVSFGPFTTTSVNATAHVDFSIRTGYVQQMLRLLEVRPTVATNNFDVAIYKDSGRTKQIYLVTAVTLDQFVSEENFALSLLDSTMYITITNHAGSARVFVVEGTIEVRD